MNEERWQYGTLTPDQIKVICEGDHDPLTWKLINTITNMQGVMTGLEVLCEYRGRQLDRFMFGDEDE